MPRGEGKPSGGTNRNGKYLTAAANDGSECAWNHRFQSIGGPSFRTPARGAAPGKAQGERRNEQRGKDRPLHHRYVPIRLAGARGARAMREVLAPTVRHGGATEGSRPRRAGTQRRGASPTRQGVEPGGSSAQ